MRTRCRGPRGLTAHVEGARDARAAASGAGGGAAAPRRPRRGAGVAVSPHASLCTTARARPGPVAQDAFIAEALHSLKGCVLVKQGLARWLRSTAWRATRLRQRRFMGARPGSPAGPARAAPAPRRSSRVVQTGACASQSPDYTARGPESSLSPDGEGSSALWGDGEGRVVAFVRFWLFKEGA